MDVSIWKSPMIKGSTVSPVNCSGVGTSVLITHWNVSRNRKKKLSISYNLFSAFQRLYRTTKANHVLQVTWVDQPLRKLEIRRKLQLNLFVGRFKLILTNLSYTVLNYFTKVYKLAILKYNSAFSKTVSKKESTITDMVALRVPYKFVIESLM